MKTYRLQFNKNNVIILTLVAVPLVGMGVLFAFLFCLPTSTPDWLIITIISLFLILISGLVVLIAVKYLTVPCRLTVETAGFYYEFERKSWFYRRNSFFSSWENVSNISENFNNGQGSFYRISFKHPDFTINLTPIKGGEVEADDFFDELVYYQEAYNLSHADAKIQARNFYQTFWARCITWLFYAMTTTIVVLSFTEMAMEWYRTATLFCFGTVWIGNYYKNTNKLY